MSLIRCTNGHMFSSRRHKNVCPYCHVLVEQEQRAATPVAQAVVDDKTMPYLGELDGIDPVTGWLVCIDGPQLGRDYRILSEKNFIGRDEDMHIRIIGDNTIAKRNHAVIVYDPKKRNFFLLPGDASGLAYLNNEAVYTPTELSGYDVIQLGSSTFLFLPLCGVHFEWENNQGEEG